MYGSLFSETEVTLTFVQGKIKNSHGGGCNSLWSKSSLIKRLGQTSIR